MFSFSNAIVSKANRTFCLYTERRKSKHTKNLTEPFWRRDICFIVEFGHSLNRRNSKESGIVFISSAPLLCVQCLTDWRFPNEKRSLQQNDMITVKWTSESWWMCIQIMPVSQTMVCLLRVWTFAKQNCARCPNFLSSNFLFYSNLFHLFDFV